MRYKTYHIFAFLTSYANAASLWDHTSATTITFSSSPTSFSLGESLKISGNQEFSTLYISSLGAVSTHSITSGILTSTAQLSNSGNIENIIFAGALINSNTLPQGTTLTEVKAETITDANNLALLQTFLSTSSDAPLFSKVWIFTFIYNTHAFQIFLGKDPNSKVVVSLNLDTDLQSNSNYNSGIYAHTQGNAECFYSFVKSTDVQFIDITIAIPCNSKFLTDCSSSSTGGTGKLEPLFKTESTLSAGYNGRIFYRHSCFPGESFALPSNSAATYEDLVCIYDADYYTYTWEQAEGSCNVLTCTPRTTPGNAVATTIGNNLFGDTITYRCPTDFEFTSTTVADFNQFQLTIACIQTTAGALEYQEISPSDVQCTAIPPGAAATTAISTAVETKFSVNVACNNNDPNADTFKKAFAGLILDLQQNNKNYQDFQVGTVECSTTNSNYVVTVNFVNVQPADTPADYGLKADLANEYLASFKSYVKSNDLGTNLAKDLGGTASTFSVLSVSVEDPTNPTAEPVKMEGAVIAAKSELQDALSESIPQIKANGETTTTFQESFTKLQDTIGAQISTVAAATNVKPEARVDIANNAMESMASLFGTWSSTTPELNATTGSIQTAVNMASSIIGILVQSAGSAKPNSNSYTAVRPDTANSFLQSLEDMLSYSFQSAANLGATQDFTSPDNAVSIKMEILDRNNLQRKSSNFGGNSKTRTAGHMFRFKRQTADGTYTQDEVGFELEPETYQKAIDDGLCGGQLFSEQRQGSDTVQSTSYLTGSARLVDLDSLMELRSQLLNHSELQKRAWDANPRQKRDSVNTDNQPDFNRVSQQFTYTENCWFTVPTDNKTIPENACISARLCGNRRVDNLAKPAKISFKGTFPNKQNIKDPVPFCGWWNVQKMVFEESGVDVMDFKYDATDSSYEINCESQHLTTFTVLWQDRSERQTALSKKRPLWWYDLWTSIFVLMILIIVPGIYFLGYNKTKDENKNQLKDVLKTTNLSTVLWLSLLMWMASYLIGQFAGTSGFPTKMFFRAGNQISVVFFFNYRLYL